MAGVSSEPQPASANSASAAKLGRRRRHMVSPGRANDETLHQWIDFAGSRLSRKRGRGAWPPCFGPRKPDLLTAAKPPRAAASSARANAASPFVRSYNHLAFGTAHHTGGRRVAS